MDEYEQDLVSIQLLRLKLNQHFPKMKMWECQELAQSLDLWLQQSLQEQLPLLVHKWLQAQLKSDQQTMNYRELWEKKFGGDSQAVKPEESTTTQSVPTDSTTASFSLVQPLGEVLEEVDSLLSSLTRFKKLLPFAYTTVPVGGNGPSVRES